MFNGEFWNTDTKTSHITRICFAERGSSIFASAWGSCFPNDCPWGEVELHLLTELDASVANESHAFATWPSDEDSTHCLMTLSNGLLTVVEIAIHSEYPSYKVVSSLRKDPVRSAEVRSTDLPLAKLKHMWDGSELGWKLVQYDTDVYLVEFNFDESGPTRADIPVIRKFVVERPGESNEQMWERLRGCEGMVVAKPLGPNAMNRLQTLQRECDFTVTVCAIGPDDYLVLSPDGNHYGGWIIFPRYRRPVIEQMINAGVPIVSSHVE